MMGVGEYEINTNRDSLFDPKELFEPVTKLTLHLHPEVILSGRVSLTIGSQLNYRFEVGTIIDSTWVFTANADHCPCPYLYGNTLTNLTGYLKSPDLVLFGYALLPALANQIPLFTNYPTPDQCIFSPQKAKEGLSSLREDGSSSSFVITNFHFSTGPDTGLWDLQPAIQLLDSSSLVVQDLQLAAINWDFSIGTQTADRAGCMVVSPPSGSTLRWYAYQAIFWLPRSATAPVDLTPGRHSAELGSLATVAYDVAQAQAVEIFKEFPGTGTAYIAFKPSVPIGSVLGAIVHSVSGDEAYSAPLLAQVLDSSRTSSVAEFHARDRVEISVNSFNLIADFTTARLTFLRGETVLKVGLASGLATGVGVSGAAFGISDVAFDLADGASLTIAVLLARSETITTARNFSVSHAELSTGDSFNLSLACAECTLVLHVLRCQPTVVFQFSAPLSSDKRAIVCRVVDDASLVLQPTEAYGIFRFRATNVSDAALIDMPGVVPLCDHRRLDGSTVLVPLVDGRTRFGDAIHVPFRRSGSVSSASAHLVRVFATTADALCGSGARLTLASPCEVACLAPVVGGASDAGRWVALQNSSSSSSSAVAIGGARSVSLQHSSSSAVAIAGDGWRLHVFAAAAGAVAIVPSVFTIPADTPFLELSAAAVAPFAAAGERITVNCTRAAWVEWRCGAPPASGRVARGADGLFAVLPCADTGLIVAAGCDDSASAFCQFDAPAVPGVALLQYASEAGVIEVGGGGGGFMPGVSRQVIARRGPAKIYKIWVGTIGRTEIVARAPLTIQVRRDGTRATIAAQFGGRPIPFSAEKCYADPDAFFAAIGVVRPAGGFRSDVVNFTGTGEVQVAVEALNVSALSDVIAIVGDVFDLPKEFVGEEAGGDGGGGGQAQKAGGAGAAVIAGAIVGAVAVVAAVAGLGWMWHRKVGQSPEEFRLVAA
jgi:hypothetical protein